MEVDLRITLKLIGRAVRLMFEDNIPLGKENIIAQIQAMSLTVAHADELIYYQLAIQLLSEQGH